MWEAIGDPPSRGGSGRFTAFRPPLGAPRPPRARARPLPCPRIGAWALNILGVVGTVLKVWCVLLVSDCSTKSVSVVRC